MTAPRVLRVGLGERSYDVRVGPGELGGVGGFLAGRRPGASAVVVTDAALTRLPHLARLEAGLDRAGMAYRRIVVPGGEASKSLERLGLILDELLAPGIERTTTVIALGGGVIGDLAGFAAAVALRGLPFVQAPTTLLAQVDSAVGGKTGVNSRHGKNLIGAFHQPELVAVDTDTLSTLPPRELRAGYAETVKYGLLGDAGFFAWLEENGRAVLDGDAEARITAIGRALAMKAAIVAEDERELSGRRALLNLGHTFAHAFEKLTGYGGALLHGEAVGLGLALAFDASARLGLCPPEDAARVRRHLAAVGLPTTAADIRPGGFPSKEVRAAMTGDKKAESGRLRFVLARGIGRAFLGGDVDDGVLDAVLVPSRPAA